MARALAELLGTDHPLFSRAIFDFEHASGNSGIDTRLIADVTEKAHAVMRSIGLDTADTSGIELYNALISAVRDGKAEQLLNGCEYVLMKHDDQLVSFNLQDVVENSHHEVTFGNQVVGHAQRHLRSEIIKRYADHDRTDNEMVHNLAEQAGIKLTEDEGHALMEPTNQQQSTGNTPRILAIGDIFTDAFITLGDDAAKVIEQDGVEYLAVPYGRKPPYEKVDIVKSVGPSPNVAVSISRLGYDASLMAWIGGDATGKEAIEHLELEKVDTESMVTEADKATSYWYVLCYNADRTMLVKSEKYRYEWTDPVTKPDYIYLAYLGEDSWPLHEGLLDYLERNPDIKFAFQPGTFQFEWGPEKLKGLYSRSNIVLMNREEAMEVTGRAHDPIHDLAQGLHDLGPEIVVITDGPNGSYVSEGGRVLTIPNYPDPAPPVERTGAGDAFSSTFVAAVAAGESIETALSWAPINSMSVVQKIGAQAGLLSKEALLGHLANAPEDYKVTEVSR